MKKSVAKAIYQTAVDEGLDSISLRKTYSGRGMYGEQTYAITGNESDYHRAVATAAANLVDNAPYNDGDFGNAIYDRAGVDAIDVDCAYDTFNKTAEQVKKFLVEALCVRTDNMGYDLVWY